MTPHGSALNLILIFVNFISTLLYICQEFNVLDTQAAEALPLVGELKPDPMLVYLVVSNLFIGALLIVILVLCATQRTNYKRQLRAAKVNAFGKKSLSC